MGKIQRKIGRWHLLVLNLEGWKKRRNFKITPAVLSFAFMASRAKGILNHNFLNMLKQLRIKLKVASKESSCSSLSLESSRVISKAGRAHRQSSVHGADSKSTTRILGQLRSVSLDNREEVVEQA
ncbi:uncharacterized protein LOC143889799 [Tasmannia lanceolata]|uniref:uncharacterized protein LOC143889799 n=1 Tax=Tasmannia lanceolata TaxID=3420 RepID=UPI004063635B